MWFIGDRGFVSVIEDRDDASLMQVRARIPGDIRAYWPDAEMLVTPGADYRFRARIPRRGVAERLKVYVEGIDYYGHFKDIAVTRSAGDQRRRHEAYYATWSALAELQTYAPYAVTPRSWAGKK